MRKIPHTMVAVLKLNILINYVDVVMTMYSGGNATNNRCLRFDQKRTARPCLIEKDVVFQLL